MEMQVVDDAVGAHGVVAEAKCGLATHLEDLKQKLDQLIRKHLWETVLREKQEQGVVLTKWILVEKHRVRLLSNLTFTILIFIFLLLHLLLGHDLFIIQVDIEQDLSRVFFQ